MKNKLHKFLNNHKDYPVLAAIAAGLYPLGHYYNWNFTFIDSWNHFFFFTSVFLIFPIFGFVSVYQITKRIVSLKPYDKYVLPILNLSVFGMLLVVNVYGFKKKIMALVLIIALVLAVKFYKHIKKILVLQLIMAIMVLVSFLPSLFAYAVHDQDWVNQKDNIEDVVFVKRPNVYMIQPDGYANFSELKNDIYNFDNASFEDLLKSNGFKLYSDFRSNYYSTLSSNASLFSMKHHYYSSFKAKTSEVFQARQLIVGDNPVLSIFKANNYKTHLIAETPYLLANKPKLKYDYSNISVAEVPYFSRGFDYERDVSLELKHLLETQEVEGNNFFFIEKILPGHVSTTKGKSKGVAREREIYLERLEWANIWLEDMISLIHKHDPNGLIIILADHGGFVGYEYSKASDTPQSDRDLVYSIFSSALAIKWPGDASEFDAKLKTNVNMFRVLFSYLSNNKSYLDSLEDDKSFRPILKDAPFGIYELINENGDVVFENISN